MSRDSIQARIAGQLMAMDLQSGWPCLAQDWPTQPMAARPDMMAGTDIRVEYGERFVTVRGVAVMPIRGMLTPDSDILERYLGWSTYAGIEAAAAELAASDEVRAVIVDANSPGGFVIGMEGAAAALARLAAVKPVLAIAAPLAASAAYALISQASSIAIVPGGMVGCIGVLGERDWPVQAAMDGNQRFITVSGLARAKRPDPTTETGRAELQRAADEAEARFHGMVARGRNIPLAELPDRLTVSADRADGGATYMAEDAIARGLADTVEVRAAFYDRVLTAYAPPPARPVPMRPARSAGARAAAAAALAKATI